MSRSGHFLAAFALGATTVALDPRPERLLLAIGLIAGASLPDQVELVFGFGNDGRRYSLFAHRGISHVPWPWAILSLVILVHSWLTQFAGGLAIGALLHILLDGFSPTGIPWVIPGRRRSFGYRHNAASAAFIYRTGTVDELILLAPIAGIGAVVVGTHLAGVLGAIDGAMTALTRLHL